MKLAVLKLLKVEFSPRKSKSALSSSHNLQTDTFYFNAFNMHIFLVEFSPGKSRYREFTKKVQ